MRQFFEAWQLYFSALQDNGAAQKMIAMATDLKMGNQVYKAPMANRLPAAGDFKPDFFMEISFTNHMEILHKIKDVEERLFYIRECALGHWSKYMLRNRLKEDFYHRLWKGALVKNLAGFESFGCH